jgi:hypothetical protein
MPKQVSHKATKSTKKMLCDLCGFVGNIDLFFQPFQTAILVFQKIIVVIGFLK